MSGKKRLLILPRYGELGASSRVRFYQYLPYLSDEWQIVVAPFFSNAYLRQLYRGHLSAYEALRGYARRLRVLRRLNDFDLVWFEAELLPWLPWGFERMLSAPVYVADYDDAIFHKYDVHKSSVVKRLLGKKIAALMRHAKTVLAGNDYIASYAQQAGARRVEIVPTVVDASRYLSELKRPPHQWTIGWIGTPRTQQYLQLIAEALEFAHRTLGARIVAIGATGTPLPNIPVEVHPWNEGTEATELGSIDVGIMPLVDSAWERGKCGYKLIQYMVCGKPVVASPVGVNRTLVEHGQNGLLASTKEEWINAFRLLHANPNLSSEMGKAGRSKVERGYSLEVMAPRVHQILTDAVTERSSCAV